MKKIALLLVVIVISSLSSFAESNNTRIFTIFTSGGCGCTGSGGPPETFTDHDEVLDMLQESTNGIDFIEFEGTITDAYNEVESKKGSYDGVMIIGRVDSDYRLAFTGLPTIIVYNMWEFQSGHHYHIFKTGQVKASGNNILEGGTNYEDVKILTAQLDRRNLSAPIVRNKMFNDLVYKVNLIQAVKELGETRILMIPNTKDEFIGEVNYKFGDFNQTYPEDHNEQYIQSFQELFGAQIVRVEPEEFYETYGKISIRKAEEIAEPWIRGARKVEASRPEIIKSARRYLALEALREKYNCNAVFQLMSDVLPEAGSLKTV